MVLFNRDFKAGRITAKSDLGCIILGKSRLFVKEISSGLLLYKRLIITGMVSTAKLQHKKAFYINNFLLTN